MSRSLERLRDALAMKLLLRNGRNYERTVRGERLLRELEVFLPRLENILQGRNFVPEESQDRFQVAMTDYGSIVVLSELVRRISTAAPKSRIEVLPWSENSFEDTRSGVWIW